MRRETGPKWGEEIPAPAPEKKADKAVEKADERPVPDKAEVPGGEEPTETPAPTPETEAKDKKQNPWKLLKAETARANQLERQIAEAKSSSLAETEKSEYLARIEKAEAKIKEYESEIQFKSYEKSEEFKTKYEQPYERAWQKHMKDMRGVTVFEDDVSRPMEANDILELVNLDLPTARKVANEKFGDFAGDVMIARKEIRDLYESKALALEEAKKTGADRERQMKEHSQKWQANTSKHVKETWEAANQAALNDPNNGEFFKPVNGDETRNQLLGKGFDLVDKAFSAVVMDPKNTPEQRAEAVRMHAAVRNRAAAFGPMKYLVKKLRAEVESLKKSNGQFKESEPSRAGGVSSPNGAAPVRARDKMLQASEKHFR